MLFPEELWTTFLIPFIMDAPRTLHNLLQVSKTMDRIVQNVFNEQMKDTAISLLYYSVLAKDINLRCNVLILDNMNEGDQIGQYFEVMGESFYNTYIKRNVNCWRGSHGHSMSSQLWETLFFLPILHTIKN